MISAAKYPVFSVTCALLLFACGNSAENTASETSASPAAAGDDWADASGDFINADGEKTGSIAFKNTPNGGVLIRIDLSDLTQGWHGVHLHQVGDCSDGAAGFKASGSHVDPENKEHGLLNPAGPEPADLPNLYAGADGRVNAEIYAGGVILHPGLSGESVVLIDDDGFAVIVHENPDDHMTQPIGGAGARVACAAIAGN